MDLVLAKYQPPSLFLTTSPRDGNTPDLKWKKQGREIHAFLEAISEGMPIKYACADSGLNYNTVAQWLNPRCAIYDSRFEDQFAKAHAHAVKAQIQRINKSRDWKAAAFWLERNVPEFHPKSAHLNVNANNADPSDNPARGSAMNQEMVAKLASAHDRLMAKLATDQGVTPKHNAPRNANEATKDGSQT